MQTRVVITRIGDIMHFEATRMWAPFAPPRVLVVVGALVRPVRPLGSHLTVRDGVE